MDTVFVILRSSQRSQILHKKISTHLLIMEVDFILKTLQCLHLNVQRMPLQVKHKRLDLKQKKICRSI